MKFLPAGGGVILWVESSTADGRLIEMALPLGRAEAVALLDQLVKAIGHDG